MVKMPKKAVLLLIGLFLLAGALDATTTAYALSLEKSAFLTVDYVTEQGGNGTMTVKVPVSHYETRNGYLPFLSIALFLGAVLFCFRMDHPKWAWLISGVMLVVAFSGAGNNLLLILE